MGSHRAAGAAGSARSPEPRRPRTGRTGRGRPILAALVAIGVVAAGIGLANAFRGEAPLSTGGPVVAATGPVRPPLTSPTPTASHGGGAPSPTPAGSPSPAVAVTPDNQASPSVAPGPRAPVWVYYDSPGGGVTADRVAVRLRAAGWLVEAVKPVEFHPPVTTVYYENRFEAAARYLRETFPGIGSAQLRPHALRQTNGLILVVTRTYAG